MADSLVLRGHRVTVWAPTVRGENNRIEAGYKLYRYPKPSSKRFGVRQTLPFLIWEYIRRGMELLHCHGAYPAAYVGASAGRILGVPLIVRPHGADILPGEWIRQDPRLEQRMRSSLLAADRIVAQGESLAAELGALGIPKARVEIIHNGVRRNPTPPVQQTGGPPYFFSVGSLSQKKGYDILLKAFHILSAEFPEMQLAIAGSGSQYPELTALAEKLSLSRRISWKGQIEGAEKERLLAGALAYVCPSRREPFSNALLEAMARGLPIVATAVGGNAEMLEDGKNALLTPPENPDAMAAAMRRMIQDAKLRRQLGPAAFERAGQFDWESMVDKYENLYQRVVKEKT